MNSLERIIRDLFRNSESVLVETDPSGDFWVRVWWKLEAKEIRRSPRDAVEYFMEKLTGEYGLRHEAERIVNAPKHSFSVRCGRRNR